MGRIEALYDRLTSRATGPRQLFAEQPEAVEFLDGFDSAVPSDCVVVADMCIPGYWLARSIRSRDLGDSAYPVGWGPSASLPGSDRCALGSRSPVVSVSGDGGFLSAAASSQPPQENVPLTAVIVDDGGYGMLRYDQRHAGEEPFGVDLVTPDFEALARSFGSRLRQSTAWARISATRSPTMSATKRLGSRCSGFTRSAAHYVARWYRSR